MKIIELDDLDDFYYKIKDNVLYWSEYGIEQLNEVESDEQSSEQICFN